MNYSAEYEIKTLNLLVGSLPKRAHQLVIEWATIHQKELLVNWANLQNEIPANKIAPLD